MHMVTEIRHLTMIWNLLSSFHNIIFEFGAWLLHSKGNLENFLSDHQLFKNNLTLTLTQLVWVILTPFNPTILTKSKIKH